MNAPLQGLDAIRLPANLPSNNPDEHTVEEEESLTEAHQRAVIQGLKQDIQERKTYAHRIFCLICGWLGAVFLLLIAQGLGAYLVIRFKLSDSVILAVIGSTTVNVLGIFYIVAHYLFPNR